MVRDGDPFDWSVSSTRGVGVEWKSSYTKTHVHDSTVPSPTVSLFFVNPVDDDTRGSITRKGGGITPRSGDALSESD